MTWMLLTDGFSWANKEKATNKKHGIVISCIFILFCLFILLLNLNLFIIRSLGEGGPAPLDPLKGPIPRPFSTSTSTFLSSEALAKEGPHPLIP
jgi:hypothetical protein